jgi:hypothetical protein
MSSRLKRLAALEAIAAKRKPTNPYVDPFDTAMRLLVDLQAVVAAKAEWRPFYGPPHWPEETQVAFERQMADYDSMSKRLTAKPAEQAA